MKFKEQDKVVAEMENSIDMVNAKLAEKENELTKLKSSNNQLKNRVNEASKDSAQDA